MTRKLHIAPDLALPLDAVTQTFAILAIRGVGKTHTASVMAEEMLKAGQPIVAYDPTGAWWGLKSSADGKQPAYPVVIFGGEHADVPLEETAGETIATTIVDKRIPAILDCSLMRKGARIRFMTAFCETLYQRNREALHLFLDEAHTVAPQNVRAMPELSRLLGAVEDIVLQGRRRGLGLTAISQRPAILNTTIRSMCQTLIAMRVVGTHDRKAVNEWIEAHGDPQTAKEMLGSLAGLPKGDGWVWNPADDIFRQVHFRARETFDSSATPKVGGRIVAPQRMAQVDLAALGEAIKATVEKAKADDPRELRKEIAELKRQLKDRPAETQTVEVEKLVEVPVLKNGQLERTEKIGAQLEAIGAKFLGEVAELRRLIAPAAAPSPTRPALPRPVPRPRPAPPQPRPLAATARTAEGITPRQQRFLDAAATLAALGVEVSRETVCGWIGVHPRGGSVGEELSALVEAGLIVYDRGVIHVTDAGLEAATPGDPAEAIENAKAGLTQRQRKFFEMILAVYPDEITREQIAEQAGIHPRGGSFGEDLGRLVGRGLVEGGRGRYRVRDFVMASR